MKFTSAPCPHSTGACLTTVWNGYSSLRSFVPNLHWTFHTAWENSPESLSVSSSDETSHSLTDKGQATVTDRLQRCNQSLPVGASEHHRVSTAREVPCHLPCFLPTRSSRTLRNHLFQACKSSQSLFSLRVHDWFLCMQHTGTDKSAVSTAGVHFPGSPSAFIFLSASRIRSKKILLAHSIFISRFAKLDIISEGITQ